MFINRKSYCHCNIKLCYHTSQIFPISCRGSELYSGYDVLFVLSVFNVKKKNMLTWKYLLNKTPEPVHQWPLLQVYFEEFLFDKKPLHSLLPTIECDLIKHSYCGGILDSSTALFLKLFFYKGSPPHITVAESTPTTSRKGCSRSTSQPQRAYGESGSPRALPKSASFIPETEYQMRLNSTAQVNCSPQI